MLLNKSHSVKNKAKKVMREKAAREYDLAQQSRRQIALNILNAGFTGDMGENLWGGEPYQLKELSLKQAYRFFNNMGDVYSSNSPAINYDWHSLDYIEDYQRTNPLKQMDDEEKEVFALDILHFMKCRHLHYDTEIKKFVWKYTPTRFERFWNKLTKKSV